MEYIQALTRLCLNDKQKEYYNHMAAVAQPVQCVSVYDVFTPDEIKSIKQLLKPQIKQCYRNSEMLCELFPNRVKYVEGYGYSIFPIEHAFNRIGDKYIDITWELALHEDVTKKQYVSLIEADRNEVVKAMLDTGEYGGYYLYKYKEK